MDMYKKAILRNLILGILMIIALVLQWIGRKNEGLYGLGVQFVSLVIILFVLWEYNRRFK